MNNFKLLGLVLVTLLSVSGVFATVTDGLFYYSFDDDDTSGSTAVDLTTNNNDGTISGATTGATGEIKEAYSFDGSGDLVNSGNIASASAISFRAIVKFDDVSTRQTIASKEGTGGYGFRLEVNSGDLYVNYNGASSYQNWNTLFSPSTGTFYEIIVVLDGSEINLYVDGVLEAQLGVSNSLLGDNKPVRIGLNHQNVGDFDGIIDEATFFNRVLTDGSCSVSSTCGGEIAELTGINPFTITPQTPNATLYVPATIESTQVGTVEISSLTYTPVLSGSFTLLNDTNISVSVSGDIIGSGSGSDASCEVTFDGTSYGNTSASAPNSEHRSLSITGFIGEATAGTYTAAVNCKKDSPNKFTAENFKFIFTEYTNEDGLPLKVVDTTATATITSSSYQPIAYYNFTTTNATTVDDIIRFIALETTTTNTYASTGEICLKGGVFGLNSSEYCRYGAAGSTGSGSAFDLIINATNETLFPFVIYGKSTTSDGTVDLTNVNFEIITHQYETNSTELNSLAINSASYTTVASLNIQNADHSSIDSLVKASFSVQSLSGSADMSFRLTLSGDATDTSTVINRDVAAANQEGIVTIQEVFNGLAVGNYTINLQAQASNTNSQITGGNMIVYPTNPTPFIPDAYNVTLYDSWTNETINTFNLTDSLGTIYSTTNGLITAVSYDASNPITTRTNVGIGSLDLDTYVHTALSFTGDVVFNSQIPSGNIFLDNSRSTASIQGPYTSYPDCTSVTYNNTGNVAFNTLDEYACVSFNNTYYILQKKGSAGQVTYTVQELPLAKLTIQSPNYITKIIAHNLSTNLNTSIFQAKIQFDAYEIITNQTVSPANFTIGNTTVTDSEYFYIKAGTYDVTFSADTYFDKTIEVTISALQTGTLNVTGVSGTVINITAANILNDASISSFDITISNDNYSYSEDYTTSVGWVTVSAIQGTAFNISINATGFAYTNTTITPNASLFNYSFGLYTSESILFNIYDEVTGDLITDTNFTIQIIGSFQAINLTTPNGTAYVDLLTPDGYEIRYYSTNTDDYKLRSYFTDVPTGSFQQIDLYALNDTSTEITSATITFKVYDQDLDPVESARVTVARYYINSNAFIQVFSRDTDTAGEAVGTFETIDAFYQYQVKIGNTVYYTSSAAGTQFTTTSTIPIYINLNTITYETSQTFDNIPTTLQYVNLTTTSGYVEYTWTYATSLPVCLYVEEITVFGEPASYSSCVSGASGNIQIPINTSGLTKDYTAQGWIEFGGNAPKLHDSISFTVNLQPPINNQSWKDVATLGALFALLIAWFMGLRYPTVSIVLMSAIFVVLTLPPLRLITITASIGMWVVAVAILLLIKVRGNA